jgi:hypothetical protein
MQVMRLRRRGSGPSSYDVLLAETIARHFEDGEVDGRTARFTVVDGIAASVECSVTDTQRLGAFETASLYLMLSGGGLGDTPVFASISGYDERSTEAAIISGACNWACALGPVLRGALTGEREGDGDLFEVTLDGRRFRVAVDRLDRVLVLEQRVEPGERIRAARARLGAEPWLTTRVLDSGTLPLLTAPAGTLLSVFVAAAPRRTVEVKVNGGDWAPSSAAFDDSPIEPEGAIALLRELAVLVPIEQAPPFESRSLARTLAGIAGGSPTPARAAGWQGWWAHDGRLGPVVEADEALDSFPEDYVDFITRVAGSGAGPGYGLLPPRVVKGVIPLAHAGCGVAWLLRLDDEHRGEVWVDAAGSDGSFEKVADCFTFWYSAWLDAAVRDNGPWLQWDSRACATASALSQLVTDLEQKGDLPSGEAGEEGPTLAGRLEPNSIALRGGGDYLEQGPLDPCHGCVALAAHFGLAPDVFAPGTLSR